MFVGKTLLANLPALLLQDVTGLPEVEQALSHGLSVFLRRRRDRVVRLLSDWCGTTPPMLVPVGCASPRHCKFWFG